MAYNISNWTTTRIESLVIPLSTMYNIDEDLKQRGWQPKRPAIVGLEGGIFVRVDGLGEGWAEGQLLPGGSSGDLFAVRNICVYGEGSGVFYWEILVPALQQSMGILEATLIWEGGDCTSRLVVEDGNLTSGQ